MNARSSPPDLPLAQLARACAEETRKYRRGEPFDGGSCFELFRRAVCDQDQLAWVSLVEQYRGVVITWVRRHPSARSIGEDDDHWVDGAFARFFQAVSPERFGQFNEVPQILRYLKLCVHSVIQDAVRAQNQRPPTVPIDVDDERQDEGGKAPIATLRSAAGVDQPSNARELWTAIEAVLRDDDERRVAYLAFVLQYKPREIQALYADRFPTMSGLYRLIRNVVDRLQRSPEIREFLA